MMMTKKERHSAASAVWCGNSDPARVYLSTTATPMARQSINPQWHNRCVYVPTKVPDLLHYGSGGLTAASFALRTLFLAIAIHRLTASARSVECKVPSRHVYATPHSTESHADDSQCTSASWYRKLESS